MFKYSHFFLFKKKTNFLILCQLIDCLCNLGGESNRTNHLVCSFIFDLVWSLYACMFTIMFFCAFPCLFGSVVHVLWGYLINHKWLELRLFSTYFHSFIHKQGTLSRTSKSLMFHPYHSQATFRVLPELLQAFSESKALSLCRNFEGILQRVSKAKWMIAKGTIVLESVYAWPDFCSKHKSLGQILLVCTGSIRPLPTLTHMFTDQHTHTDTQPDRHNVTPGVCCLTVGQQAQINSPTSHPHSSSSLLLTRETFLRRSQCDLTFPESFTRPAKHCCVS